MPNEAATDTEKRVIPYQESSSFFAVLSAVLQCEVAVLGCYGDTV